MDIEYITKLIELVAKSQVDEIEIEEDGKKIRIAKTPQAVGATQATVFNVAQPAAQIIAPPQALALPAPLAQTPVQVSQSAPTISAPSKLHEVKCPIVGTFYRAPSPESAPFVQIGATIQKGGALCIVEAMKLMNEIESDITGKIVQIMVENGQPVEYDQVLFLIEPA